MYIRKANERDLSRIAEILVFTKRMNYRCIFHNDLVSFGEMQVLPTINEYRDKLDSIWVYDDQFVKGLIRLEEDEIKELYVDHFFQNESIGTALISYAKEFGSRWLWVLEKNYKGIMFYERNGFIKTQERQLQEGTDEYLIKMKLK